VHGRNATHTTHNLLTLHDQTLRFINKGYTGTEIAEMIKLPPGRGTHITGDAGALQTMLAALDRPDPDFDIVTP
jgi:alkyl sulfatase BDS1-like metallo-beta-lactamase superfamily hydrolase